MDELTQTGDLSDRPFQQCFGQEMISRNRRSPNNLGKRNRRLEVSLCKGVKEAKITLEVAIVNVTIQFTRNVIGNVALMAILSLCDYGIGW